METCPRCGDWTPYDPGECDACGYVWDPGEGPGPDLLPEIERLIAIVDELPEGYWPSWVHWLALGRCEVASEPAKPCEVCGELTQTRARPIAVGAACCPGCVLEAESATWARWAAKLDALVEPPARGQMELFG